MLTTTATIHRFSSHWKIKVPSKRLTTLFTKNPDLISLSLGISLDIKVSTAFSIQPMVIEGLFANDAHGWTGSTLLALNSFERWWWRSGLQLSPVPLFFSPPNWNSLPLHPLVPRRISEVLSLRGEQESLQVSVLGSCASRFWWDH